MNDAIDENDDAYFNGDGQKVIKDCFYGVLVQNKNNTAFMPVAFRQMVEGVLGVLFEWPNNKAFGNCFKYLWQQYATNVQTNLKTHCEKRLRQFFKMRAYELNQLILRGELMNQPLFDDRDIVNAVNYTFKRKNTTQGDAQRSQKLGVLLEELYYVGAPFTPGDEFNIRAFTEQHWFQSLRMWLNIQRDIDRFHLAFSELTAEWQRFRKNPLTHPEPHYPAPPEIRNFAAIPMCSFQRRHIQIDTDALYQILCGIKLVPRMISGENKKGQVKWRNFKFDEFNRHKVAGWGMFFDLNKIEGFVKRKKRFVERI